MATKANTTANDSREVKWLPSTGRFVDGRHLGPEGGISGSWSVAHPDRVMAGRLDLPSNGHVPFAAQRLAAFVIADGRRLARKGFVTSGAEAEFGFVDRHTGHYASVVNQAGDYTGQLATVEGLTPELFAMMGEIGTAVVAAPNDTERALRRRMGDVASAAMHHDVLVMPGSMFGQHRVGRRDSNQHPYITFTDQYIERRTGFIATELFKMAGVQFHAEILDTLAAMQAAEFYQQITALLGAPSLAGPFVNGQIESTVLSGPPTEQQRQHLAQIGVLPDDLRGRYHSWRYPHRRAASPSAGPWLEPAPATVDQLLLKANDKLSTQDIATIDRYFGEHSDCRLRLALGTVEVCNYDTFAGHPKKIAAFQTLTTAILTNLQLMQLYGQDPAREFPELFGHANGQAALDAANRHNFAVARHGMDAVVNGQRVSDCCESLITLATRHQLFPLDANMQDEVRRSYTSNTDTRAELRHWCTRNNCLPSMAAYYEMGIGTPSVYLLARAEALRKQSPTLPMAEIVRLCELDMAQAYINELENAA